MLPISILELGRVREGYDLRDALTFTRIVAQHAERLGYKRVWVAEHHNIASVSTAATSVVIGYIAEGTKSIRVGAGGIMLPNHAPYVIAEQFGTLAALYPGRIDLGLGRAPGSDQATIYALRRDPRDADNFPSDVEELQYFLNDAEAEQKIVAIPGAGSKVPLWILGSSLFGAQFAAHAGLPFGFASHFAPQLLDQAISLYRRNFALAGHKTKPYVMVGVNVIAADTDEEARYLATSQQMSFADLVSGRPSVLRPPIPDIESYWSPLVKTHAAQMLSCTIVGGRETVKEQLRDFVLRTNCDELIVVSDIYDHLKRLRSLEIIAEVMGLIGI